MKVKLPVVFCLGVLAVAPVFAQTKTITNAELEKFRQKRMQAEKDYRENYAKMGFPSPEELGRQIEKSRVERDALSARLTAERLQREKVEAERLEIARYNDRYLNSNNSVLSDPGYYSSYPTTIYLGRRFPRYRPNHYNYPVNVGNGIPIVNYYGYPTGRTIRPSSRWLRR